MMVRDFSFFFVVLFIKLFDTYNFLLLWYYCHG